MIAGKLDLHKRWEFNPTGGGSGWYVQIGRLALVVYRAQPGDLFRHRYVVRLQVGVFQAVLSLLDVRP